MNNKSIYFQHKESINAENKGELQMTTEKYVLVIKEGHNVKIGRKLYSKEEAEVRLLELEIAGITNMEIMEFNQAYGLQNENSTTKGGL